MVALPFFLYTSTPEYLKYFIHSYCAFKHSNTSTSFSLWVPYFYCFYLSIPHRIFIPYTYTSSCVTVQCMSHSSRTKDHGTILSWNEICIMVIAPFFDPELLLACFIYCKLPGKLCLLSPKTKYFRWKHCAKMICESSVPNRVGIWTMLL